MGYLNIISLIKSIKAKSYEIHSLKMWNIIHSHIPICLITYYFTWLQVYAKFLYIEHFLTPRKTQISSSAFRYTIAFWWIACGFTERQVILPELPVIQSKPTPVASEFTISRPPVSRSF